MKKFLEFTCGLVFVFAASAQVIGTHALDANAAPDPLFANLDCKDEDNLPQQQMNECKKRKWLKADKELQNLYDSLLAKLTEKQELDKRTTLINAERKWVKEKESACAEKNMPDAGGSLGVLEVYSCQLEWTEKRIEYLRSFKI
jgi:uncharacterized protein YecT (DUF1311 family)